MFWVGQFSDWQVTEGVVKSVIFRAGHNIPLTGLLCSTLGVVTATLQHSFLSTPINP